MRLAALAVLALAVAAPPLVAQAGPPDTSDHFQWLESLNGDSAMAWVRQQNARTLSVLEHDPRFGKLQAEALTVLQANDRIPMPEVIGGQVYNFWQDSAHVRGIWRRTTLAGYRSAVPTWTTVIDLDTLAAAEHANWVWQGAVCAWPAERRCMIMLSDGGEDAATAREFDLETRRFVPDGFVLPRAKMTVAWMGEDTLLAASEWSPGEVTTSGYPYIVKRLVRGQPVASAVEVYRGTPNDMIVAPATVGDGTGHRITIIERRPSFFEAVRYVVSPDGIDSLATPLKSSLAAMVDGQLILQLAEPWPGGGSTIPTGSLAAIDAAAATRDPAHLVPTAVFVPGPRESVSGAQATRDRLFIGINHNVNGRVLLAARGAHGGWTTTRLALPDNISSHLVTADQSGSDAFIGVAGFLTPSSVWLANAGRGDVVQLKSVSPKFDASRDTVEQLEATSTDGTKIPYFIVHPRGMARDGTNPTVLYAYGGFEISLTPVYDPVLGKLWLERGGVYVRANIRGGGEFGPAWHEAGLKTHRQIIYDDFAAVARDLIARGITSPRRLGIRGGSNGGLLMGVEFTQHPELWNAVDIQVPLLDMLRFEQIQAGKSWVGEYGSVSNPDERRFLKSISPYHNLRAGVQYPEPLVWTTTKDDRVGPQHARKFAAKLAEMGIPYLFYEETEGGHAAGANIREQAHTLALEYTYLAGKLMGPSPDGAH